MPFAAKGSPRLLRLIRAPGSRESVPRPRRGAARHRSKIRRLSRSSESDSRGRSAKRQGAETRERMLALRELKAGEAFIMTIAGADEAETEDREGEGWASR